MYTEYHKTPDEWEHLTQTLSLANMNICDVEDKYCDVSQNSSDLHTLLLSSKITTNTTHNYYPIFTALKSNTVFPIKSILNAQN